MDAFRPLWSSKTTRATPERSLATSERKKAVQPAPSSVVITSKPSHSCCPSLFTPVVMMAPVLTTRPPSLTLG